ncbi:MAG: hypothetical protein LBE82_03410 [Chitinophagaceae bacterium]|jgi:hypothetical protein|nr:hypothetical protein [Chitinophagaceae bacterium]
MKSTIKKIGFAVLITVMSVFAANAQNASPKAIALLNKASWCPVCQANGARVEKDLMPMLMQDKNILLVMNDLSDDKTKAASKEMLNKAGIASIAKKNTGTGMLYFIDAKSKKVISSVSIAEPNEKIMMTYKEALAK